MLPRRLLYFLLFLLGPVILPAQVPDIRFEKYTAQNGLTQNSTGALLQDSHGFLWIAGWGLNRFDGRVFKQYNKTGENALVDLSVSSLAEDKEGNIWIGTANGLSCLDPFTEKFTNYTQGNAPHNIPDGFCRVYVDKEDNVWVGGTSTISLFHRSTATFENIPVSTSGNDIRINRYIGGFLEDRKGRFWISTSYGIKLFDRSAKKYRSYFFEEKNGEGRAENSTQQLFEDKDGNIWAGTWNCGVLKYDEAKDRFISYSFIKFDEHDDGEQTVHSINDIVLDDHYYLLIASESGLFLTDPAKVNGSKMPVLKLFREADEGGAVSIKNKWQILKDRQGNYWISGFSGLLKIDPGSQSFQWKPLPGEEHKIDGIFHVIPDPKAPGQKFFLTTKAGWWQYDMVSQTFHVHVLPKDAKELLEYLNWFVPAENGYWFTSATGIGFYDLSANKVTEITPLLKTEKENIVRTGVICLDNMGRIWFSVYRTGIRIYDPATKKIISMFADSTGKDNLIGKSIFDMKKLPDGTVLFTNANNVFHIDPRDLSYKKIETPEITGPGELERMGPRKILFDKNNRVLILAWQRIYLFRDDSLIPLYPLKGPASFNMQDFLQDGNSDFWVNTNLGLFKADPGFKEWVNMSDKIPAGNSDNISELFRSPDDQFIITTTGRIGTFSLASLNKNKTAPAIIINRLRTGNREQYLVSLKQQQWKVSFKDAIEIELSAINFSNEKGNRIFYKLEERDDDWKELTGSPVIRYEQLPPGNYELKVKAVNGDGVWSKETNLLFKVLPPFWITWWFISLCILGIAGILYVFYRYRVQQLIKEERLRSHIATDLHDDIGATLSSISFYSETIKQQTAAQLPQLTPMLDKMGETSREMVGNMSDIVWAINPENDPFEKMLGRMQNLAAELCAVKNIQLHFDADERLNSLQLSMEQRRNIYLIFKEALNNALKYAACRNITIRLEKENNLLVLYVKDDGKGFDEKMVAEKRTGGNGLKNMQHRAAEINGKLKIDTEENKGTTVLLRTSVT